MLAFYSVLGAELWRVSVTLDSELPSSSLQLGKLILISWFLFNRKIVLLLFFSSCPLTSASWHTLWETLLHVEAQPRNLTQILIAPLTHGLILAL